MKLFWLLKKVRLKWGTFHHQLTRPVCFIKMLFTRVVILFYLERELFGSNSILVTDFVIDLVFRALFDTLLVVDSYESQTNYL